MFIKKVLKTALLFILPIFFYLNPANAQEEKKESDFKAGFGGMIGLSFNPNSLALNVGGPNIRYRIKENLALGLGAFPSLFYSTSPNLAVGAEQSNRFEPKLGLSPRIDFKNIVIIAPVYHFSDPERWIWTIGLGYKFH